VLIEMDINLDDYRAYLRTVKKTHLKTSPLLFFVYAAIGIIFVVVYVVFDLHIHLPTALVVVGLMVLIANVHLLVSQRKLYPEEDGVILGRQTLAIDDEGIRVRKEHYESFTQWSGVKSMQETRKHYFIMLDRITAHIIPRRSFSDEGQVREFEALIHKNVTSRT
jgi:hypothetical protein